jgi:hypothetical protein
MTNIQTIFDFCPPVLKKVAGYCIDIVLFVDCQLLKVVFFYLVDGVRYHLYHTMPGRWISIGKPKCLAP